VIHVEYPLVFLVVSPEEYLNVEVLLHHSQTATDHSSQTDNKLIIILHHHHIHFLALSNMETLHAIYRIIFRLERKLTFDENFTVQ
jgi:hypothetical protein